MFIFVSKKQLVPFLSLASACRERDSRHVDISFQLGVCSQHTNKGLEFALCWLCAVEQAPQALRNLASLFFSERLRLAGDVVQG